MEITDRKCKYCGRVHHDVAKLTDEEFIKFQTDETKIGFIEQRLTDGISDNDLKKIFMDEEIECGGRITAWWEAMKIKYDLDVSDAARVYKVDMVEHTIYFDD